MMILKYSLPKSDGKNIKVDHFPFSLGRSIDNDLILEDSSISAYHAWIEKCGEEYFIQDNSSTHGLIFGQQKYSRLRLQGNKSFYLGGVKIEVYCQDLMEKTSEISLQQIFSLENKKWQDDLLKVLGSYLLVILFYAFKSLLTEPLKKETFDRSMIEIFGACFGTALVAGLLSLFSKLQRQEYHFLHFLWVLNLFLAISFPFSLALFPLSFFINHFSFEIFLSQWGIFLLVAPLIYILGQILYPYAKRKRLLIGTLSLLFLILILRKVLITVYDREGRNQYSGRLFYPAFNFSKEIYSYPSLWKAIDQSLSIVNERRQKAILLKEEESLEKREEKRVKE